MLHTFSYCVLECVDPSACPPGSKYADVIQFRTVALPGGIPARQDLIRLTAYNQYDEVKVYTGTVSYTHLTLPTKLSV